MREGACVWTRVLWSTFIFHYSWNMQNTLSTPLESFKPQRDTDAFASLFS